MGFWAQSLTRIFVFQEGWQQGFEVGDVGAGVRGMSIHSVGLLSLGVPNIPGGMQ